MSLAGRNSESTAWIGLGSNLGDGGKQIARALDFLQQSSTIQVLRTSPLYSTRPWGMTEQADFTNAVAQLLVRTGPLQLMQELKRIEQVMGRKHGGPRWGPRKIDLDLLLYDKLILLRPGLTVPHPRMHLRAFVLAPLFDLQPELIIPARGTVRTCLARLQIRDHGSLGVERLTNENFSWK